MKSTKAATGRHDGRIEHDKDCNQSQNRVFPSDGIPDRFVDKIGHAGITMVTNLLYPLRQFRPVFPDEFASFFDTASIDGRQGGHEFGNEEINRILHRL